MKLKHIFNQSLINTFMLKYLSLVLIFMFFSLASAQTPEPVPALKALHWHPNSGRIAVGYADGRVEVIAAATAEVLFTFSDADGSADKVLWSHDGSKFAAGIGKKIYIWDDETFRLQHILEGHETPVASLAWGPDNIDLASVSFTSPESGQLKFWNTLSGQERLSKAILADSLTWDVTQNRLATLIPLTIVVLDPSTAEYTPLCDNCLSDATYDMEWSPDGSKIAAATRSYIAFRDPQAVSQSGIDGNGRSFYSIAWSPNSLYLASGDSEGQVQIWNVETLALTQEIVTGQEAIYAVDWSPDGTRLAYGGTDGRLEIRAVDQRLSLNPGELLGLASVTRTTPAWSPDSQKFAVIDNNTVRIIDATSLQTTLTLVGHTDEVFAIAWSPDGTKIATGSADQTARIWDSQTGQIIHTLFGHNEMVTAIAWSPDGERFISMRPLESPTLFVWDVETGVLLSTHSAGTASEPSVAFSPYGSRFAHVTAHSLIIHDGDTFQRIGDFEVEADRTTNMYTAAWNANGSQIVTGSYDGQIWVWDAGTGRILQEYTGDLYHLPDAFYYPYDLGMMRFVRMAAFLSDSTTILSISGDGTAQFWDTRTQQITDSFRLPHAPIYAAALSPDERKIAYIDINERVRVTDITQTRDKLWSYVYADFGGSETHIYALNPFRMDTPTKIATVPSSLDDSTSSYDFADLRNGTFALSPNSRWLAMTYVPTLAQHEWLHVLDLDTGDIHPVLRSETSIEQMSWSADGNFLAFDAKRESDVNQDTYVYNTMAQGLGNIDNDSDLPAHFLWLNQGVTLVTHKVINPGNEGQYCYYCETVLEEYNVLTQSRRTLTDFDAIRSIAKDYPFHLICDMSSSASGRYIAFKVGCQPAMVPFHLEYYVYDRVDGTLRSATPFTATEEDSEVSFFNADYAVDWYGDLLAVSVYAAQGYAPADAPNFPTPKPPVNATYLYDPATDTRHTLFADTFFDALTASVDNRTLALHRPDEKAFLITTLSDTAIETTQTLANPSAVACDFDWMPENTVLTFTVPPVSQSDCGGESEIHFVDVASGQRVTYPLTVDHRLIGWIKATDME